MTNLRDMFNVIILKGAGIELRKYLRKYLRQFEFIFYINYPGIWKLLTLLTIT